MMPTGNSTGARIVRATRSQATRKAAPNSADAGSTRGWWGPTSSRTRCGMMMPTNPIGPPIETAAPVASDALKNAARCAFATSSPRDSALSGQSDSRLSGRASQAKTPNATSVVGSAASTG